MQPRKSPGRRTGSRVRIPPDRLASGRIFSRGSERFAVEEVRAWDQRNRLLLDRYGLRIASVTRVPLDLDASQWVSRATAGPLQTDHRDRLLLTCALGALAVSVSGRGDLLAYPESERAERKLTVKENNDRNATAAMNESLHALCEADPTTSIRIAIGEGARKKPGERGGNPTLYAGQIIGTGPKRYSMAVDTVEGTSKSTVFDSSCGTLLFATEAPIAMVPDFYFDKCQLRGVSDVTVADPLDRIIEAVMDTRGSTEVDFFALDRARHPIDRMVELGANMRLDTDGDAFPAIAAGLAWGVFPDNLRPLDGLCADIGGAAETIASAAGALYLGVSSTARFCGSKVESWDARYDLAPDEDEQIRAAGFDPAKVYDIAELVPGVETADGAFVTAAISDNWHIPGLDAVYVGGNFATVHALFIGSAGTADIYRITFDYELPYVDTVAALTPVLTKILARPVADIPAAVREATTDTAQACRLRNEVATSFYAHFSTPAAEIDTPGSDAPMRLDLERAAKSETPEGIAFLRAIVKAAPDWFA